MKKSLCWKWYNKIITLCGAVALMAVASGASVHPKIEEKKATQKLTENFQKMDR